jgi:BirA family biotin operon repressor/biotin-[acetyl-CoA-carboxylase] ligase
MTMDDDRLVRHDELLSVPLPFARTVLRCEVVDSTNSLTRSRLLQGLDALPLVVWAKEQTLGRGQRQSQWWSDNGSLTFTIAINPRTHGLRVDQEPRLSLATALAVVKAIHSSGWKDSGIGIRWPNDIEVGGRKLGGVLPERVETELGHHIVIGVGLNVLTQLDQAPPAIKDMAASLAALQSVPMDGDPIQRLLAAILGQFDRELRNLTQECPNQVQEWNRLNLLRDQTVWVNLGPQTIEGRVQAIDRQGALCLADSGNMQMYRLFGGQILRNAPKNERNLT